MIQKEKEEKVIDENVIEEMYKNGAHFGYRHSKRHPSVSSYIYDIKGNNEIFDLEKTYKLFTDSYDFVKSSASLGKTILFVGGKHEAWEAIKQSAEFAGMPYAIGRWIGGTITNFNEIKKRIKHFTELKEKREVGEFVKKYTKKERILIDREIKDLEEKFGGIEGMQKIPDVVYVVDPKNEEMVVREAIKSGLPIVALASSDCNLGEIDYPIPANDSARASIEYFTKKIADACVEGRKEKESAKEKAEEAEKKE